MNIESYIRPLLSRTYSVNLAFANKKLFRDYSYRQASVVHSSYFNNLFYIEFSLPASLRIHTNSDRLKVVWANTKLSWISFVKSLLAQMVELQSTRNRAILKLPHISVSRDALTVPNYYRISCNPTRSYIPPRFYNIRRMLTGSMSKNKSSWTTLDPAVFFLGLESRIGLLTAAAMAITIRNVHRIHYTILGLAAVVAPYLGMIASRKENMSW